MRRTSASAGHTRHRSAAASAAVCLAGALLAAGNAAAQNVANPGPNEDASLTWRGVTLYGVVDVGLQYQTHGAAASDYIAYSTEPVIQKNSNRSVTALTSSPLSWSRIGIAGNEPLGADWAAVFRLETYFNPTSGDLSDGLKSLTLNNGRSAAAQTANLDSSVAGQLFGGGAVLGVSSPSYGSLTVGRQATPLAEGIVRYDAVEDGQDSGHAFSLLGGSRTAAGGGVTQDTRLDRSVKYSADYGWLHLGGLYQLSDAAGTAGSAVQGQLGARFAHGSLDTFYAKKYDAISASALSAAQLAGLAPGFPASHSVAATVSDNTAYALMGLYRLGTLTLYGGYEHIRFANPATPLVSGDLDIGGYVLAYVNNAAYDRERVLQIFWGGAKWFVTPGLYVAGGYYGYRQDSFAAGKNAGCSSAANSACSGRESGIGLLAAYRITRRCDAYLGSLWTEVQDGLASGFLNTATVTTTVGVRVKF